MLLDEASNEEITMVVPILGARGEIDLVVGSCSVHEGTLVGVRRREVWDGGCGG